MTSAYPDIEGQLYTSGAPDATYTEAEARQRAASHREVKGLVGTEVDSAVEDAKAYADALFARTPVRHVESRHTSFESLAPGFWYVPLESRATALGLPVADHGFLIVHHYGPGNTSTTGAAWFFPLTSGGLWNRALRGGTWEGWRAADLREALEATPSLPPGGVDGDVLTRTGTGYQWTPPVTDTASAYVIVGPGRPDQPTTTAGTITGDEPVGAGYRSTDGAGVGAWVWRKRPNGWSVADGDTGWRVIALADPYTSGQTLKARRIGDQCYLEPNGPQTNEMWNPGVTKEHTAVDLIRLGAGFAPAIRRLTPMLGAKAETLGYVAVLPSTDAGVRLANSASTNLTFSLQWTTAQPWPTTLPGSPA